MRNISNWKHSMTLFASVSMVVLASVVAASSIAEKRTPPAPIALPDSFVSPVPKAVCGPGDRPETGLQGQVPMALRLQPAGFQGFSCNLQLLAQVKGEGAARMNDEYREGGGRNRKACAYHSTGSPETSANNPGRTNFGVRAIDISDPTKPQTTAYLTTRAMLYPHESLKANKRRQLLGAARGDNGPEFDIYDVSGDCRYPQLLSSVVLLSPDSTAPIRGHEGRWAPDGLTYYGSDNTFVVDTATNSRGQIYVIDTTDTTKPTVIKTFTIGVPGATTHGLTVSDDGNRGYFASNGSNGGMMGLLDPTVPANNGLLVLDLSEIQARRPNPQVRRIGSVFWKDGSTATGIVHVKIKGKPYVLHTDEFGTAGASTGPGIAQVCAVGGFAVGPQARLIDISDERNPKVISKLQLEVHDPANCDAILADVVTPTDFFFSMAVTIAVSITVTRPRRLHAATSCQACGYSIFAIRFVHAKSRTTTRRACRPQVLARRHTSTGDPAVLIGVDRKCISTQNWERSGRRARTMGS
jgi:hypothetical protein